MHSKVPSSSVKMGVFEVCFWSDSDRELRVIVDILLYPAGQKRRERSDDYFHGERYGSILLQFCSAFTPFGSAFTLFCSIWLQFCSNSAPFYSTFTPFGSTRTPLLLHFTPFLLNFYLIFTRFVLNSPSLPPSVRLSADGPSRGGAALKDQGEALLRQRNAAVRLCKAISSRF